MAPPTLHARVEAAFAAWGRGLVAARWLPIALGLALTAALGAQIPRIEAEASSESMLRPGDDAKQRYDAFKARFGNDQFVMIVLEPPGVFERDFLERLRALHHELEDEVPYLVEVRSLINARSTRGRDDELIVEDLLDEMPRDAAELAALRELVMATPSYRDLVISGDGRVTTLVLELDLHAVEIDADAALGGFDTPDPARSARRGELQSLTLREQQEVVASVREVLARHAGPELGIRGLAGAPLVTVEVVAGMNRDVARFTLASLALCALLLGALFRRTLAVLLPLGVVSLALVSTAGLMPLLGVPFTPPLQNLPSFLLAVGIAHSVHVLSVFYQRLDGGDPAARAIERTLAHAGPPVAMTGLTTAVGLVGFLGTSLAPIADFGLLAIAGVGLTLIYTLALLPALLVTLPQRARPASEQARQDSALLRALAACGALAVRAPRRIAALAALLIAVSTVGALGIRFEMDPMTWLPASHPQRLATYWIDDRLGGTTSLEVVIDTGVENGLYEPATLRRVEALESRVRAYRDEGVRLGRTLSVLDIARETHQALNENRPDHYDIAPTRALLGQELFLFENSGSDDLEDVVDSQFRWARFTLRAPQGDSVALAAFVERAARDFEQLLGPGIDASFTGQLHLQARGMEATVSSMVRSYAVAFALITPLMMLLIGNVRAGLVSMVPNLIPVVMTLAVLAAADVAIDIFTLQVGCIAIGLAVDDTIHLIHGFRRELERSGDPVEAIHATLRVTGRALLFTSLVLISGFLVFGLSSMNSLRYFGFATALAIGTAFLLDVLVTPALLLLVTRRRGMLRG